MMKSSIPSVSVIIPNYNGELLLKKFLYQTVKFCENNTIVIIDDFSLDNSVNFIMTNFPNIKLLQQKQHIGYAACVNLAVASVKSDIVILLNTDVVPTKKFITPLLKYFSDPLVFAVGCMDISHENGVTIKRGRAIAQWSAGFLMHNRGEIDKSDTAWVSGGSAAFKKVLWDKFGGMNELFKPFYWEDIDLSYVALKSGYKIFFEPRSIVHHYHDSGAIKTQYSSFYIRIINWRNHFLFIWKNVSNIQILIDHFFNTIFRIIRSIICFDFSYIFGLLYAFLMLPKALVMRSKFSNYWKLDDIDVYT